MRIAEIGEFGLIERIRRKTFRQGLRAPFGIGDDAAVLRIASSGMLLATADMLIEGIHFDLRTTDLRSLGWKAAAVNLSDIAAMGGRPRFCLTSVGIPASLPVEGVTAFYRGLNDCLRKFGAVLVGGDTCGSRRGFTIAVTMLGETVRRTAVTRSGARPGDRIFVTGTLGDSGAGMELLKARTTSRKSGAARLIARHLRPLPRIAEGMKLAASGVASAMIDVSDGLSSDLGHLCRESGVGAEVRIAAVPLSRDLRAAAPLLKRPGMDQALHGGEDYELLFTVPKKNISRLQALRLGVSEIGVITKRQGVYAVEDDGCMARLRAGGYDHFGSAAE